MRISCSVETRTLTRADNITQPGRGEERRTIWTISPRKLNYLSHFHTKLLSGKLTDWLGWDLGPLCRADLSDCFSINDIPHALLSSSWDLFHKWLFPTFIIIKTTTAPRPTARAQRLWVFFFTCNLLWLSAPWPAPDCLPSVITRQRDRERNRERQNSLQN